MAGIVFYLFDPKELLKDEVGHAAYAHQPPGFSIIVVFGLQKSNVLADVLIKKHGNFRWGKLKRGIFWLLRLSTYFVLCCAAFIFWDIGSKGGAGVWQRIGREVPPCDVIVSAPDALALLQSQFCVTREFYALANRRLNVTEKIIG